MMNISPANFTSGGVTMCEKIQMADDQHGGPLAGLVEVVFVGGPYHARRILMASPEFRMELEQSSGERITYCRHMLEAELRDGHYMNVATYAPGGVSDEEFARLVMDAVRLR